MSTGAGCLLDPADDDLPEPQQIGQVAGEFLLGAIDAGRADDEAERPWADSSSQQDVAEAAAVFVVFDLARDADAAERGHQHQVAAGNADVGGERRAFGADAFFDDLHQHFVAAAEDLLNGRLDAGADAGALARGAGAAAATAMRFIVLTVVIAVAVVACGAVGALIERLWDRNRLGESIAARRR